MGRQRSEKGLVLAAREGQRCCVEGVEIAVERVSDSSPGNWMAALQREKNRPVWRISLFSGKVERSCPVALCGRGGCAVEVPSRESRPYLNLAPPTSYQSAIKAVAD